MNPAIAQIMIQQIEQSAAAGDPSSTALKMILNNVAQATEDQERRKDPARSNQVLRRQVRRLSREVNALTELVAYFAGLFGACAKCLGEDEECPACRGHGGSGYLAPDQEQLMSWAEPALKRLGKCVVDISDVKVTRFDHDPQEI